MKDNKKINKTRRNRGYNWEDTIVKRFNAKEGWSAVRLGGASTKLPDVFLINNDMKTVIAVEAKSTTTNTCRIPAEQIQRCLDWVEKFKVYDERQVMFAFKFSQVKRISSDRKDTRKLKEYFCFWDETQTLSEYICDYDGNLFQRNDDDDDGKRIKVTRISESFI